MRDSVFDWSRTTRGKLMRLPDDAPYKDALERQVTTLDMFMSMSKTQLVALDEVGETGADEVIAWREANIDRLDELDQTGGQPMAESKKERDERLAREREERDLAEARGDNEEGKTIHVVSLLDAKPDGGHQVALFEIDSAHPGGQAYVAGPLPAEVAPTAEVSKAIAEKRVKEVTADEAADIKSAHQKERATIRKDGLQAAREQREASEAAGG